MVNSTLERIAQEGRMFHLTPEQVIHITKQHPCVYRLIADACSALLEKYDGNITRFCRGMSMPRQSAYNLFAKCGISPDKKHR